MEGDYGGVRPEAKQLAEADVQAQEFVDTSLLSGRIAWRVNSYDIYLGINN